MNSTQTLSTKDLYIQKMNKLKKSQLNYVTIVPDNSIKSLEQFRYIIKKCFRDISKTYYQKSENENYSSKNYINYVSVIELNKSITQNKKLLNDSTFFIRKLFNKSDEFQMSETGYHTHIFFESFLKDSRVNPKKLKSIIRNEFKKNHINVDMKTYIEKDLYDVNTFIMYHTKQLKQLDNNFVVSNI